jgi:hypothetical protein
MADPAQHNTLLDTVAKQKTDIDDKNVALALAQKQLDDRDRIIKEASDQIKVKEIQEQKLKQQIKFLEEKLKAVNLSGGMATHAGGTGIGVATSTMVTGALGTPPSGPTIPTVTDPSGTVDTSPAASAPTSIDSASAHGHRLRMPTFKMEEDVEVFLSRYECYCKIEHVNDIEKAGHLILNLDPKFMLLLIEN